MSVLDLSIERLAGQAEQLRLVSPSLVVAGYTGRDVDAVERHVAELADVGVPPPREVPTFWALPNWLLAVAHDGVEVGTPASSGEAEPVLIKGADGSLYVTVGSDHTDRELERSSISLAKMVGPKLVAGSAWPFEEVAASWDGLRLRSYVGDDEAPYQADTLASIRSPLELLARAEDLAARPGRALVLFLGTVPLLADGFRYEPHFTAVLEDPERGRQLRCPYRVDRVATATPAGARTQGGTMKQELEFFDVSAIPWEPIEGSPGLSQRILAGEKDSPDHSRMLRFAPGTVTNETLTHDYWEEVWILEGSLHDLRLAQTFTAGMYACRPPGMPHGPWEAPGACVTFEVRYRDRSD